MFTFKKGSEKYINLFLAYFSVSYTADVLVILESVSN